jgi:hypothetical protein
MKSAFEAVEVDLPSLWVLVARMVSSFAHPIVVQYLDHPLLGEVVVLFLLALNSNNLTDNYIHPLSLQRQYTLGQPDMSVSFVHVLQDF